MTNRIEIRCKLYLWFVAILKQDQVIVTGNANNDDIEHVHVLIMADVKINLLEAVLLLFHIRTSFIIAIYYDALTAAK